MAKISLVNLNKTFDNKVTAVKDFNLEIDDREFIVFVGPSGCGKSTTLRMIAGLEVITSGDFILDEKRLNNVGPKDRDIAMVFQNYAIYPHMNVYNNMAFGLKIRKFNKEEIDRRVQNAANILGLKDFLHRKPRALSGGQRQRVALGRAIVRDAKVFLMDEPLSNLDAKLRVQMRSEIQKLHKRLQTTTIYVTHDQTEAMTMATRLVVMKDGVIQQVGAPKDVYDYPNNMFVAGFIGSPAMNFFYGKYADGYFVMNSTRVKIPEEKANALTAKGYNGKDLILGIRPEGILEDKEFVAANPETEIAAKVDVAELMGSETFLYSRLGNQDFVARVDAKYGITSGQTIHYALDVDQAHFFDDDERFRIILDE